MHMARVKVIVAFLNAGNAPKMLHVQVLPNVTGTHPALATAVSVQHRHCHSDVSLRDLHFFGLLTRHLTGDLQMTAT